MTHIEKLYAPHAEYPKSFENDGDKNYFTANFYDTFIEVNPKERLKELKTYLKGPKDTESILISEILSIIN